MKLKFFPVCCILLSFLSLTAKAQEAPLINNDSLLKFYLTQPHLGLDSNADALVIYEKGNADITINTEDAIAEQTFKYTVERYIKINTQQALDLADITVPFSKNLDISDLDFESVNLVNGVVIKEKIKRKDILKEKLSGDMKIYKLNFPNVKAGSMIYYTYTYKFRLGPTATSTYFPVNWNFQSKYPTLESVLEFSIPAIMSYSAIPKNVNFVKVNSKADFDKNDTAFYRYGNIKNGKTYHLWKRKNLAGITDENFVLNADNLAEKLNIYIAYFYKNSGLQPGKIIPESWAKANGDFFYNNRYLGQWVFHSSDSLSFALNKILAGTTSNLETAKKIYKYVRDSFECTGYSMYNRIWANRTPRIALRDKKGTISDMNLLLTALLRKAGLKSYPMLLCTSDRDKISEEHFEPDALNYLVSVLIIDNTFYLLDASSRYLPFGVLIPRCYNGFTWVVNDKGIGLNIVADSLVERSVSMATLTPAQHPGLYRLKLEQKLGNVSGPAMREMLTEDSVTVKKELEQQISKLKYKTKLKNYYFSNKNNPDTSLKITYDLELELDTTGGMTYLNPFFRKFFDTNPFTDATRKHPVEFGNAFNHQFILKFQLPPGYEPEDYNNPANLNFNNIIFYQNRASYDAGSNTLSLIATLSSKTAVVPPEDYKDLRSFYDRIITEQNKKIVIRKIR